LPGPGQINREGPLAESVNNHGAFVWSIAELLRGDYKQSEYQKVVLPLVVIRRLDAVLEPTKDAVLTKYEQYKDQSIERLTGWGSNLSSSPSTERRSSRLPLLVRSTWTRSRATGTGER